MNLSVGKGWECNVGYNEDGNSCRSLQVPEHAYPIYGRFESRWECERGYRRTGDACTALRVPENGYLTEAGDGFKCDRGFQKRGDSMCAPLLLPSNAHINFSGHDWDCNRGYRRRGASCLAISVPGHAYATACPSKICPGKRRL